MSREQAQEYLDDMVRQRGYPTYEKLISSKKINHLIMLLKKKTIRLHLV